MSAQFEDKRGLKFPNLLEYAARFHDKWRRLQCPNSLVAEERRQGTGSLETKCAARNLGISIRNPSPPLACSWGMYAHKY